MVYLCEKEGCINAANEIIAIMDTDGQQVKDVVNSIEKLSSQNLDIVSEVGFYRIHPLKV